LPYPLKQPLRYIYGAVPYYIRLGKEFRKTAAFLQESQWWDQKRLEAYQMEQLSRLLNHAYENTPYYRRVFEERGLKPENIQDFNDLKKLPYLTREDVRNNFGDLQAKSIPRAKLQYVSTSGSTGIPLHFYTESGVTTPREMAFHGRMRGWVGYRFTDRCAVLRGNVVERFEGNNRAWWEYNPVDKLLILSVFHMTEDNLLHYIEKLNEFQADFISTFPSSITILAHFMREHDIRLAHPFKAILCGSENLYLAQRKLLAEVFQCRVFSWYGNTEMVTLAGECEADSRYHIFTEYGVTELINSDGNSVTTEGEIAEIVGTGFNNYATPFIRYKTGDLTRYTSQRCSCGRNYPLIDRVEGRSQEFLVARDGRPVSLGDMQIFFVFDNIKQFQFYQEKEGEVIFNIVKKDTFTQGDTERIKSALYDRFSDSVEMDIRYVDTIPRTESGKYKFIIQKLPVNSPAQME